MLTTTVGKWFWDARRSVAGWTLAIVGVGCGYAAFWPTIDDPGIQEALESYPEGLLDALNYDDISTAAGYLTASVYGLLAAVLLIVYGVSKGTRAIAGDERDGTLELILAHPVGRRRLALERFAALAVSVVVIVGAFWLAMLAMIVPADLGDVSVAGFVAMHLHLACFAVLFAALSFSVGAATGHASAAIGVGAGVGVLGWVANGIVPQVDGLGWVDRISPFHWLTGHDPLRTGVHLGDVALMVGSTVALVAWGSWAFARRDVAV